MKYVVALGGELRRVSLDGEGVHYDGKLLPVELSDPGGTPVHVLTIGTQVYRIVVQRLEGRGNYTIWVNGYRFDAEALDERTRAIRELSGATKGPSGPAPIKAPMPGLIVRVNVNVGDDVHAGQGVVVMEAMKMENELRAIGPGRVRSVLVTPGTAVEKGAVLVELE